MSFPKKKMTDEELAQARENHQGRVFAFVNALHDGGFGRVRVESMQVGREQYWTTVVLDESHLEPARFALALRIAFRMNAHALLREDRHDGPTRLAFALYLSETEN